MARKRRPEDPGGSIDAAVAPVAATTGSFSRVAGSDEGDPREESIRRRAQEIYERRQAMGLPGDAAGDWLQAEAELGSQAEPRP